MNPAAQTKSITPGAALVLAQIKLAADGAIALRLARLVGGK